jgi:hypothetical protein
MGINGKNGLSGIFLYNVPADKVRIPAASRANPAESRDPPGRGHPGWTVKFRDMAMLCVYQFGG